MFLVFLLDLLFLHTVVKHATQKALPELTRTASTSSQPVQCSLLTKLDEAEAKVRLGKWLCVAAPQMQFLNQQ